MYEFGQVSQEVQNRVTHSDMHKLKAFVYGRAGLSNCLDTKDEIKAKSGCLLG